MTTNSRSLVLPFKIFHQLKSCSDQLAQLKIPDLLLGIPYLSAVEEALKGTMEFRYILFYHESRPVGFSYGQIYPFSARESIKTLREKNRCESFLKIVLAQWAEFTSLVCGNLLLTGQYGYYFSPGHQKEVNQSLHLAWEHLFEIESKKNRDLSVHFVKDFDDEHDDPVVSFLEGHDYFRFKVQPSMFLEINSSWKSLDDYLGDLKSKYRIRIKQAQRRSAEVKKTEIALDDLEANRDQFQKLLNNVLQESDFRIVDFDMQYLIEVKKKLEDFFKIRAYYLDQKLVGFMTYFLDRGKMLAHFTGFDLVLNKEYDLYLNMLIDLVDQAITEGVFELDLSRTAMEIKSSIGAVPRSMTNFIRHRSRTKHKLLPNVFNTLYTPQAWVQRKPFRQD